MDEFDLQSCEAGLCDGVVQAGARPSHGAGDAGLSQQGLGNPVARSANAVAQLPGNLGCVNVRAPRHEDRLMAELTGTWPQARPEVWHGQSKGAGIGDGPHDAGIHSSPRCGNRSRGPASAWLWVSMLGQGARLSGLWQHCVCQSTGPSNRCAFLPAPREQLP